MFWFVPIEPLEERYTSQMFRWVNETLRSRSIPYQVIKGKPLSDTTEGGQFLNWTSTSAYKATQVREIAKLFHLGQVKDGDVFFVGDIWFPGIEAIAYLRDALKINCKIYGVNYAGPFDKTDLTYPMLYWGSYMEAAWYAMFEAVFVGSEYHRNLILQGMNKWVPHFKGLEEKLIVTGLVWKPSEIVQLAEFYNPADVRPMVIWPHRLSPEKNVRQLYETVEMLRGQDIRWVITSGRLSQTYTPEMPEVEFLTVTKPQYYGMLRYAKVMYSTSFHENYGYTVREATALKTPVLCPRRADYPEMILTQENLYEITEEAAGKIIRAIQGELPPAQLKPMRGFDHMLDVMEGE